MEQEKEQSEFNMALNYLGRLNSLFYICDESAMSLNIYQWFHTLQALYRELSTEMSDKELEEVKALSKDLSQKVNKHMSDSTRGRGSIDQELYTSLHEFELRIRRVLKTSGLQMKMKSDPRKSLT